MTDHLSSLLQQAVLVTGNAGKASELGRISDLEIAWQDVELPEIQDLDLLTVARAKAREARRHFGRAVLVDETGLELSALAGFPGPMVKWMLQAVGADGIARTAAALGDTRATARCIIVYVDAQIETWGIGSTSGDLRLPPRGEAGFGWDPVFVPTGETRSYAELPADRKDEIGHRGKAWRALLAAFADLET